MGHLDVVKLLIAKDANVNKANNSGETPLLVASNGGYADVVKALLDASADVNKATKRGSNSSWGSL